jgi:hypothetical protein
MSGVLSLLWVGGRRFGVAATRHGGELGSKQGHFGGFTPPGGIFVERLKKRGQFKGLPYFLFGLLHVASRWLVHRLWNLVIVGFM